MDCNAQMNHASTSIKQRGITLIETMGAMAIASTMLVGMTMLIDNALEDLKGQQASLYQSQVANAARRYIAANYEQLLANLPTTTATLAVSVGTLKTARLLPTGFATNNVYGQSTCTLIKKRASLNPTLSQVIDALVVTYGGTKIAEKDIAAVAMNSGAGGGYIRTASPATAQGAAWQLNTSAYNGVGCTSGGTTVLTGGTVDGGHLVTALLYDGPGQLSTDFLYRSAIPGRSDLNQMNTPLLLAQNALVSKGAACGINAALAVDIASRQLLTCGSDGIWADAVKTQWKQPIASYGALPSSGNQTGDVRMVTDLNRAFTYNGSGWTALAVDENGDLTVPRHLTVDSGNVNVSNGDLNIASGDVNAWAGSLNGATMMAWDWSWTSAITVTDRFNPGDPCNIFKGYSNGSPVYMKAMGTYVLDNDTTPIPMVCTYDPGSNSYHYRYMNGSLYR